MRSGNWDCCANTLLSLAPFQVACLFFFFNFYTYMCTFCRSSELMTSKAEEENRDYTDISSNYGWRSVLNKELIVTPVSRRHETRFKRFPHWYNRDRGRRSRSFSTELCDSMQPFNKCTPDPAVSDGGKSIKMHHQQHGHGQLQNTRQWRFISNSPHSWDSYPGMHRILKN